MSNQPIFYDTDCLSCFIEVKKTLILERIFDKITIPIAGYKEFKQPKGNNRIKEVDRLKRIYRYQIHLLQYSRALYIQTD